MRRRRLPTPSRWNGCGEPERSCSESSTPTSSRTGRRPRARSSGRRGTGRDRICGGSSGGSGAAAAAELAAGTLGTDTAGSIRSRPVSAASPGSGRRPAGLEPGRRARELDVRHRRPDRPHGPGLCAAARGRGGHDRDDPSSAAVPVSPYASLLEGGVAGLRIGVVASLFERGVDGRIAAVVREALDEQAAGARLSDVRSRSSTSSGRSSRRCSSPRPQPRISSGCGRSCPTTVRTSRSSLTGLLLPSTTYVLGPASPAARLRELQGGDRRGRRSRRADDAGCPAADRRGDRRARRSCDSVSAEPDPVQLALELRRRAGRERSRGFVEGLPVGLASWAGGSTRRPCCRAAHTFQQATDWHERRPPRRSTKWR